MGMRIGIIINKFAGSDNKLRLQQKIAMALFRCELHFCIPENFQELQSFIETKILKKQIDNLVICGGDGTVNTCLQHLMRLSVGGETLPSLTIVSSGTANDLASELGLKKEVETVVRAVLEDSVKKIDVIQIEANNKKMYMLTNGGIGIASMAADMANQIKTKLRKIHKGQNQSALKTTALRLGQFAVNKIGKHFYEAIFLKALQEWSKENWEIEIEIENQKKIITKSPFILINNQPQIGHSFVPAPYTSNNDGTYNLFISEMHSPIERLTNVMNIRKGLIFEKNGLNKSFEIKNCKFRSLNSKRGMIFFGDGEILHRNIFEANISILKQALSIAVRVPR